MAQDVLDAEEIALLKSHVGQNGILEEGKSFLWILSFRWCIAGAYLGHIAPHRILIGHPSFFTTAGKDYAALAREGAGPDCSWRYYGPVIELNPFQVLKTVPYNGKLHRGEPLPQPANG